MPSSDVRDRLLQDFIDSRGGSALPPSAAPAKKVEPLIDSTIELEGTHTYNELTGTTGKYKDCKSKVFKDEDWPEFMQQYIPDVIDMEYDDVFFRIWRSIDLGHNTFVVGPTGSGKDVSLRQICALRRMPYGRLTGNENITLDMAIGCIQLSEQGTVFSEKVAMHFCRHGGLLVLSEPAAMPRVMFALQSALEDKNPHIEVPDHTDPDSRMVNVNPLTVFAATSNVRGVGDERSRHSATGVLDESTRNRFQSTIYKPYMDSALEKQILKSIFPQATDSFISKAVALGNMIRDAYDKRQLTSSWSLRTVKPWIEQSLMYGSAAEGFSSTYWDKLDDAEKGAVQGFWTAVGFDERL